MRRPWAVYSKSGLLLIRKMTERFARKIARAYDGAKVVYEPNYQDQMEVE